MPLIALAGVALAGIGSAAVAIGGAISAGVAAVGGIMGVMEISAGVGAVLNVVGSVTHDKGLQTAGMVLGGIGAVGSLAGAAGLLGDVGPGLFGTASDIAAGGSGTAAGAANTGSATFDATTGAWTPGAQGFPDMVGAMNGSAELPSAVSQSGIFNANGGIPNDAVPQTSAAPASSGMPNPSPTPGGGGLINNPSVSGATSTATNAVPAGVGITPSQVTGEMSSSPGMLSGVGDFFRNDSSGMMHYGMIQAAGSLIQGAFNTVTPAQVAQLEAQAANNRAAAALTAQQTKNMQSGIPAARLAPVTGAPAGSGLINSPVTGSVAPPTGAPAYG